MKRALFILLGLSIATTVAGFVLTVRPMKWPANLGTLEWRRALGEKAEEIVEEAVQ